MKNISIHPGVYRFDWPYLMAYFVPNNTGEVEVNKCEVELYVGQHQNLQEGKLITIIISSYNFSNIQSKFEHIATKIRLVFFDEICMGTHNNLSEDSICWIERRRYSKSGGIGSGDTLHEVKMQWNKKTQKYTDPSWN